MDDTRKLSWKFKYSQHHWNKHSHQFKSCDKAITEYGQASSANADSNKWQDAHKAPWPLSSGEPVSALVTGEHVLPFSVCRSRLLHFPHLCEAHKYCEIIHSPWKNIWTLQGFASSAQSLPSHRWHQGSRGQHLVKSPGETEMTDASSLHPKHLLQIRSGCWPVPSAEVFHCRAELPADDLPSHHRHMDIPSDREEIDVWCSCHFASQWIPWWEKRRQFHKVK